MYAPPIELDIVSEGAQKRWEIVGAVWQVY
jgi:hypothetical protein